MKTLTETEARRAHLIPLTTGYRPEESGMLENVIGDMRRGNRPFALVPDPEGHPEVWVEPIPGFSAAD
jgi:hypothetical protein